MRHSIHAATAHSMKLEDRIGYPPMLLEFQYADPRAEELAAKARDALSGGMRRFLADGAIKDLWTAVTAGEHYVEQRVGGLPKFDEFGIEGQIDLVGRSAAAFVMLPFGGVKHRGLDRPRRAQRRRRPCRGLEAGSQRRQPRQSPVADLRPLGRDEVPG